MIVIDYYVINFIIYLKLKSSNYEIWFFLNFKIFVLKGIPI